MMFRSKKLQDAKMEESKLQKITAAVGRKYG